MSAVARMMLLLKWLITGGLMSLLLVWQVTATQSTDELHAFSANNEYELSVTQVLTKIQAGQLNDAMTLIDQHLETFPKSQIGHLLRGDILHVMAGGTIDDKTNAVLNIEQREDLLAQLKKRWWHAVVIDQTVHEKIPGALLKIGRHKTVIVADLHHGRLYLYENREGEPYLLRDYYMSVGSKGYGKQVEGDNKTPVGVYHVNRYIPGQKLPDLYGKGAFPVNYPNRWDRAQDRTGYGIWLHGTPSDTYARAPWSSEGCFVLSNHDLLDIAPHISVPEQTPVILSDNINWLTRSELQQQRKAKLALLERWREDWESLDMQRYLQHYQRNNFNFGALSYSRWAERKRALNDNKLFVQIDLQIEDLFVYPGVQDMFVVSFTQRYLSNNHQSETRKQQYWKLNKDNNWKIIYEGELPPRE